MSLRERAAAEADGWPAATTTPAPSGEQRPAQPVDEPDDLPEVVYTDPITDVDQVPVHVAWARVMRDVKSIAKSGRADIKTDKGGYKFNYRGIDMVLNAVGPALRRHGVMVIPVKVAASYGMAGRMRDVQVNVTYEIRGPKGDMITAQSVGEGLDAGERGTPKALTTAYRNLLITALTIPTEDPKMDPDRVNVQREEARFDPLAYRDEALSTRTSVSRLSQMIQELRSLNRGGELVANETGDEEKLGNLLIRIRRERTAPPPAAGDDWPTAAQPGSAADQ
ncbi:ERF family protein [Micromonospora lupini]|uniref:ERF family protein n=1 Tax=Micromonospora lupini TaxID=285679 RepID=UPI0022554D0E|nr:ERF family protein [Micromonospora lupini]MCX5066946.1 ERF family protein [Micromonospora lupini]